MVMCDRCRSYHRNEQGRVANILEGFSETEFQTIQELLILSGQEKSLTLLSVLLRR